MICVSFWKGSVCGVCVCVQAKFKYFVNMGIIIQIDLHFSFLQKNFTLVVLAIVAVSVVPIGVEVLNARREEAQKGEGKGA